MTNEKIIDIYNTIPKDLRGRDKRLATLQGLKDVASDVVDIQISVKNFIESQLNEITKLYDDFWEKNPDIETNPYSDMQDLFVKLYGYGEDNDFEDVANTIRKLIEKK